jgi:hypothetical protein
MKLSKVLIPYSQMDAKLFAGTDKTHHCELRWLPRPYWFVEQIVDRQAWIDAPRALQLRCALARIAGSANEFQRKRKHHSVPPPN